LEDSVKLSEDIEGDVINNEKKVCVVTPLEHPCNISVVCLYVCGVSVKLSEDIERDVINNEKKVCVVTPLEHPCHISVV
jgi:hypothetical protein